MFRYKHDNIVYYFEKEIHYLDAKEKGYDLSYLQMAMIAVNVDTNTVIKCRYEFVDVFDKLMAAELLKK